MMNGTLKADFHLLKQQNYNLHLDRLIHYHSSKLLYSVVNFNDFADAIKSVSS